MGKFNLFLLAATLPPVALYVAMALIGSLFTASNMFIVSDWDTSAKGLFAVLSTWWVIGAIWSEISEAKDD